MVCGVSIGPCSCRHFLACCSRLLDINTARVTKVYIQLILSGRTVSLLSVHPGIEPQVVQKKLEEFPAFSKSNGGKIFILVIV